MDADGIPEFYGLAPGSSDSGSRTGRADFLVGAASSSDDPSKG